MASSHGNISGSYTTRGQENEKKRRQEELVSLLAFWSDDDLVVEPEVSRSLYERERDCELTLSGSLDLVKQNPNIIWSHVADALQELHIARLKLKTYDAGKIRETLNIWRGLVAFDRSRSSSLALALTSFGRLYCSIGRYAEAEEVCLEATSLYRDIFADNPKEGRESSFFTMICLTEVYLVTNRCDDAERALRMATGFLKKITVEKSRYERVLDHMRRKLSDNSRGRNSKGNYYLRDEAVDCCRNASRLWRWGSLQEAEASYLRAIVIYRDPTAMEDDVERRARLSEALDELGRLCCQPKFAKYEDAERYFTEAVAIQRELSNLDSSYADSFATILLNLASYYERQKRREELEQTLREALATLETREGTFNPIIPSARIRLANLLRRSNRTEEAVEEYRRALELWDKAQGNDALRCRAEIATARFRSAELYKRAKRWDEAEESYDVAQRLFRELSERDRDSYAHKLASSLNNLATLRSNSERGAVSDVEYMLAERNYHEALTLYRGLREKDSSSVKFEFATALYNSALLHEKLNSADKAEEEYLEALDIQRGLAEEKPEEYAENVARILNNLAVLYRADSSNPLRSEKAEPLYEEALRIYERLERDRPNAYARKIVRTLRNLASVHLQDPDRKELAEEEYRRAVTLLLDLIRRFPDVAGYKSELADVYFRLGAIYRESGSLNDAKLRFFDAVVKYEELARGNSRKYSCKLAETYDELSELHQATGAFNDALQARESSVRIYEEATREQPNDKTLMSKLATANYRLALVCQKFGKEERARSAYLADLSILNKLSQEEPKAFRIDRARTYNNLAIISQKLNRIEDAETEYEAAAGLYRELEADEPNAYKNDLSKTLNNLAVLYQESGRLADAEKNFVDVITIRRELASENPQEYRTFLGSSLFNLSCFYFDQGRLRESESYCREATLIFEDCSSDDEQRRNYERAATKLRGIRDEIEEREIREAFVEQSNDYPQETLDNIGERVAYVYVSSQGDEASVERDFLARNIFPRVRNFCKERGVEFALIDLRQGETRKPDDARVLTSGLREIARTRPFFIGLVGDQYGQILEQTTLEQNAEFERVVLSAREIVEPRMSALEAEFQFAAMRETRKVDALFGLRSFETEEAGSGRRGEKPGTEPFKKLTMLKRKLRAQKSHPTIEYKSLEELGDQIERALIDWVERLFDATSDVRGTQEDAQKTFVKRLRQKYAPNQADYDALDAFAKSDSSVLTVVGASGVGKSSLLANWSARLERENPSRRVVTYYIGADERADTPTDVLSFLTQTLASNESTFEFLKEKSVLTLEERTLAFSYAVAEFLKASDENELIVVVDGLDRLIDVGGAKELTWLPRLPKRAKYLLSTSEDEALEAVVRRGWNVYELKPVSRERRLEFVREFSKERALESSEERQAQIADLPFVSDWRSLRAFLDATSDCASKFADETFACFNACRSFDEAFDVLFTQIENDFNDDVSGATLQDVITTSTLLAASFRGLTLDELRRASGFSTLKLLTILNELNNALEVKGDRRRFANESLRRFIIERYVQNTQDARRRLIELYESDDDFERRLEIPFQYFQLGAWNELKESLFDVDKFAALYDGTRACYFCKYWDAAIRDEEKSVDFGRLFELELSSKASDVGAYWRASGDFARSYQDVSNAEKAYCRALDALRESTTKNDEESLRTLKRLSSLYCEQGRFEDAERILRDGLDALSTPDASILVEISALCRRQGRLDEAEKLCADAYSLLESSSDKRGLTVTTLEAARARYDSRQFEQAQREYEDALKRLRDLAKDNPFAFERQVATVLEESSRLLIESKNYEEAEFRLLEAESIYRKLDQDARGACDFELATTLDDYARLYYQTRRLDEADGKSREAVSVWRELALKDVRFSENFASTLEFSAKICFDLGELEDAEDALQDALQIRRTRKEEREAARILCGLGNLCRLRNDLNGAEQDWLEARDIYRNLATEAQGVYDRDWARLQCALGDFYLAQEKFEKAEENYCDALVLYRGLVRNNAEEYELELARLLDKSGGVCWLNLQRQDAEVYYREALELYVATSQEKPRDYKRRVAEITRRLAFVDVEASRVEDAEREFTEALKLERELEQEESKNATNELAEILYGLANLHAADKRLVEAEAEYQEALKLRRRQAQESPETYNCEVAATLASLATLHRQVNRLSESDAEFQTTLELYRDLAKNDPTRFKPNLASTLKNLAELHDEFNRKTKADVEFNEASTIYRELNDETPDAFNLELVATLRRWAEFCRESNRSTDAREKYYEIAFVCRKEPLEKRGEDYFDALDNLAELLSQTEENNEALKVYRELIQARCQKETKDRESTSLLANALHKSAFLRFDAGEYALAASEYETLATISRVLASSDLNDGADDLSRAFERLNAAYDADAYDRRRAD